jgi:Domain of unknown function (DUF5666)
MKRGIWIAGTWVALAAATILAACGGGSSGGSPSASGSGMAGASGTITGFGSVFVNGKEFATNASTRVLDGDNDDAASSTSSLQVGMTVDVDADSGTATMLRFTSAVRGEVDQVDTMGSTMTVLGQTVKITTGTSFAGNVGNSSAGSMPKRLSDVQVGDYAVVFGFLECTGSSCSSGATIVATLVNEPASVGKYRLQGYVTNYSSSGSGASFNINGLTVDIATSGASATQCNTMNCTFNNGDFVSVRSTSKPTGTFSPSGSTLTLAADDIKLRPVAPTFAAGSTVTIEGPVSQLSGNTFVVHGIMVDASGVASSVTGLANNQVVEVTGTISSSGTLMATSINVEQHATFLLMGALDSVSATGFSVLGESFTVTSDTRLGDRQMDERPFNSTNLSAVLKQGDQVIVAAYPSSGGGNVATRVERIPTPSSPQAAVAGVVTQDSSSADTMTIAGVTVTLNSSTKLFYPGAGSSPTLSGFFAAITPNSTVAAAFGAPGSMTSTITAADAAALSTGNHWED